MSDQEGDLVDRIYEAAVLPELWPDVLTTLANYGGADAAVLFAESLDVSQLVTTANFSDTMRDYISQGWFNRTDRTKRLLAKKHAGFVTDLDIYTTDEFAREPVFQEFFNPRGFGTGAASVIKVPTGDRLIFDVERSLERGPFPADAVSRLDGMRPHLARAAMMAARMRLQTVRAAAQALEIVGLAAVVLGRKGRPLAMNRMCERLLGDQVLDGARFALTDPAADALLSNALIELSYRASVAPRSIPLAARGDQVPTVLHLLPIRRSAIDLFVSAEAIAVLTPLTTSHAPDLSVLEGLFDLTAAEARVARGIVSGSTVADLSLSFGTSSATVRSQLKTVMSKTGVSRQAELVKLLAGSTLPTPPMTKT